jgi:3-methyladenine DNA glycosylase AlkD
MPSLKDELHRLIRQGHAEVIAGFFQTGPGQYGEGDRFLGIRVPEIRAVAKRDDGQSDIRGLLRSEWHEERLLALLILVRRFERGDEAAQRAIYDFYLSETRWINNWDLVDVSAYKIVGAWLLGRSRAPLKKLAASHSLWERRIAIVSTFAFIRSGHLEETFSISKKLLGDPEDLIHKACGWMLRECGKRDERELVRFLNAHRRSMPRTMLRYAIEKFPEKRRQEFLAR